MIRHSPKAPWAILVPAAALLACATPVPPTIGPAGPPLSEEPLAAGPSLGETICLSGVVGYKATRDPALLAAEIAHFKALGVQTVRWNLDWVWVEQTKGVYDLEVLAAPLLALREAGIRSVGMLGYGHPLYTGRSDGDRFYPSEPAPFAAYAAAVARRFGTQIEAYEIWNEPNAGFRFWKPQEDPVRFAELVDASTRAIAQECPDCTVLFGGVFWHQEVIQGGVDFIRQAYEAVPTLRTSLGGLAVHPYTFYPPVAAPDSRKSPEVPLDEMLAQAAAATGAFPLPESWITEVGWPIYEQTDEARQASMLVKAYVMASRARARVTCWYNLLDGPYFGQFPPEHDFGLLFHDPAGTANARPKRAYRALQSIALNLGPLSFSRDRVEELGLREGDGALLFRDAAGTRAATVLWRTTRTRTDTIEVPLHQGVTGTPVLLDQEGQPLPLELKDGKALVALTYAPKILLE